jgi:hypothetical protein
VIVLSEVLIIVFESLCGVLLCFLYISGKWLEKEKNRMIVQLQCSIDDIHYFPSSPYE